MAKGEKDPLPVYELHPPEWLPPAHASGDIGYIGFYPPRPNDVEETLTEASVKHGLVLKPEVLAEHYSQQHEIRKRLMQDDALSVLEDVMNQIFARKAESAPSIPSSSFRLPSRVTLNDGKRLAWFADLANPDIPLSKLGKNVPHGAKGHDLLDLLHTNNVAIPRAVWFLRVFGANESAGLRNRPSYNPTQYSVEWANVMTSYMKKQLADIALPSAPRLVASIKQTFKGVLSDADMRQKWISRFSYCLSLLRTFYAEGLVDNRTFLAWLVQQMSTCNLAQAGFVRCGLELEWQAGEIRAADASGRAREGDSTALYDQAARRAQSRTSPSWRPGHRGGTARGGLGSVARHSSGTVLRARSRSRSVGVYMAALRAIRVVLARRARGYFAHDYRLLSLQRGSECKQSPPRPPSPHASPSPLLVLSHAVLETTWHQNAPVVRPFLLVPIPLLLSQPSRRADAKPSTATAPTISHLSRPPVLRSAPHRLG